MPANSLRDHDTSERTQNTHAHTTLPRKQIAPQTATKLHTHNTHTRSIKMKKSTGEGLRVLVGGGSGFIGSALTRHLASRGHSLRLISRTVRNLFIN
jgi:FlaA1/EpsC-like NDP-sugar epimerase